MGEKPSALQLDADDTLTGDVPDPVTGQLVASLTPCYIEVDTQAFSQFNQQQTAWSHNFENADNYMCTYCTAYAGSGTDHDYWGLYILGAYESYMMQEDNDPDESERGTIGLTIWMSHPTCIILNETINDMVANHGASLDHLRKEVVVHETGHTLGIKGHDLAVPPQTVMWSYENNLAYEHYIADTVFNFSDAEVLSIRQLKNNMYE